MGHVAQRVIKPRESSYRYRVLEGHPWQPRLFVDDKSRAQAVLAEFLVRAELWPFCVRNLRVIDIKHCVVHWDLDREYNIHAPTQEYYYRYRDIKPCVSRLRRKALRS